MSTCSGLQARNRDSSQLRMIMCVCACVTHTSTTAPSQPRILKTSSMLKVRESIKGTHAMHTCFAHLQHWYYQ